MDNRNRRTRTRRLPKVRKEVVMAIAEKMKVDMRRMGAHRALIEQMITVRNDNPGLYRAVSRELVDLYRDAEEEPEPVEFAVYFFVLGYNALRAQFEVDALERWLG